MPHVVRSQMAIYYESLGQGAPVLLHGGLGGDRTLWLRAGYLAGLSGFRAILFDPRGQGRSGRPVEPAYHRAPDHVADVLAVLDELGLRRAALCCFGEGCLVGLGLAAHRPNRVAGLVLLGSVGEAHGPARPALARGLRAEGMEALLRHIGRREGRVVPLHLEGQIRETDARSAALRLEAWSPSSGDPDGLPPPPVPTLIVSGQEAPSREDLERLAARLPQGRIVLLPGVGELGAFLRPDLALPEMLGFLETIVTAEPEGKPAAGAK